MQQVNDVLQEIEADEIPQLIICNKIDRLEGVEPHIDYNEEGRPERVWISAQQGLGIELLEKALTECLRQSMQICQLAIPPYAGKVAATMHEYDCIVEQHYDENGNWIVNIRLPVTDWHKLNKRLDGQLDVFLVK
jgi:GTP-binding protein HflX